MTIVVAVVFGVIWTLVQGAFVEIGNLPASVSIHEDTTVSTFLYSVTAYSPAGVDSCNFSAGVSGLFKITAVGSASDTFYRVDSVATPGFDYNVSQSYPLSIECIQGGVNDTQTLTVAVIENSPPVFSNLPGSVIVSAKTVKLGHAIFTVSYTDADDAPPLAYSGVSTTPADGPFTISNDIVTATADLLDNENETYVLKFDVADARTTSAQKITITINDENNRPTIDNLNANISIAELTSGRVLIFDIAHSDADGDPVTFEYATENASNSIFDLLGTTGEIYLQDGAALDYETTVQYVFDVKVRDYIHPMTGPSKVLTLDVIDVNEDPYYNGTGTPSPVTLEESASGTIIGIPDVLCLDPDNVGASTPDTITYSILTDTYTSYFAIDTSTAQVSLASDWDYDDKALPTSVTLVIRCSDPDLVFADTNYVITFTDINDNDPICLPSQTMFNLTYQQNTTEKLLNTQCSDRDETENAALTYAVTGQSQGYGAVNFEIDSSGNVSLKTNFTMTFDTSFYITVVVADQGSTPRSTTVTLTVYYTAAPVAAFVWDEVDTCFLCTTAAITMIAAAGLVLTMFVIFCGVLAILKLCHDHEKKKIIKALSKRKKKTRFAFKRQANDMADETYEDYQRDITDVDGDTRLRHTTNSIHRNGHVSNTGAVDDTPGSITPGRNGHAETDHRRRSLQELSRD